MNVANNSPRSSSQTAFAHDHQTPPQTHTVAESQIPVQDLHAQEDILSSSHDTPNDNAATTQPTYLLPAADPRHLEVVNSYLQDAVTAEENLEREADAENVDDQFDAIMQLINGGFDPNATTDEEGNTMTHVAVIQGRLDVIQFLKDKGANLDACNGNGETPLNLAAFYRKLEIVEYLVDNGAAIEPSKKNMDPALYSAAGGGDVSVIQYLISKGANVDQFGLRGMTPLFSAVAMDRLEAVKCLIEHGANPDGIATSLNLMNATPLIIAVKEGHYDIAEFLLSKECSVNHMDVRGRTALYFAVENDAMEFVELLSRHGADLNQATAAGNTALHVAVANERLQITDFLIGKHVEVDVPNQEGRTPLGIASYLGDMAAAKLLVEKHGADPDHTAYNDANALLTAISEGHIELAEYLADKVKNSDARNSNGMTALLLCAYKGHLGLLKFLIKKGHDINLTGSDDNPLFAGRTALMAAARGHFEVVNYLVDELGVELNKVDAKGRHALMYAAWHEPKEILQFLIDRKADVNIADVEGVTALYRALIFSDSGSVMLDEHIDMLIRAGAQLDTDISIVKVADVEREMELTRAVGRIWFEVLTAPTELLQLKASLESEGKTLNPEEAIELQRLEHNANALLARLYARNADDSMVLADNEVLVRVAAVTWRSQADLSESFTKHRYLAQFLNTGRIAITEESQAAMRDILGDLDISVWTDEECTIPERTFPRLARITQSILVKFGLKTEGLGEDFDVVNVQ